MDLTRRQKHNQKSVVVLEKNSQDPHGLSALIKETAFKEYQKVIEIQFQNLAKLQPQSLQLKDLDQNSASKSRPIFTHHWSLLKIPKQLQLALSDSTHQPESHQPSLKSIIELVIAR